MKVLIIGSFEGSNDRFRYLIDSDFVTNPGVKHLVENGPGALGCPTFEEILRQAEISKVGIPDKTFELIVIDEFREVNGVPVPVYKSL